MTKSLKQQKILIIALRFLGDVLLTTPLIHSLRLAYPDAIIDMLVFANTLGMLEGNPDIDHIITSQNRPGIRQNVQLMCKICRRYDIAIITQAGDRPFLYGLLAAPFRIGIVPPVGSTGWWKRFFLKFWVEHDDLNTHTVLQNLKLLEGLNIPPCYSLTPPRLNDEQSLKTRFPFLETLEDYAVLHPHPQWTYKQWRIDAWIEIGLYLKQRGIKLVLSGGKDQDEMEYVGYIASKLPEDAINLAGQLSLAELALVLAGAKLYVGPDTGITHLASAMGIAVIAIYGPTNPVKWAPWPFGYNQNTNPFMRVGSQQLNNIHLVQGQGDCVPCHLEGCDRHQRSRSVCLDSLSFEKITAVIDELLPL